MLTSTTTTSYKKVQVAWPDHEQILEDMTCEDSCETVLEMLLELSLVSFPVIMVKTELVRADTSLVPARDKHY